MQIRTANTEPYGDETPPESRREPAGRPGKRGPNRSNCHCAVRDPQLLRMDATSSIGKFAICFRARDTTVYNARWERGARSAALLALTLTSTPRASIFTHPTTTTRHHVAIPNPKDHEGRCRARHRRRPRGRQRLACAPAGGARARRVSAEDGVHRCVPH